ncbi:tRNA (adenine(37)-N6)-methyltransferase [Tautogolabrus adspersus]
MSPLCDSCGENINKLNQQVSVMRKEIKNLREMLASAIRAHRKHMTSVQSAVSKIKQCEPDEDQTPSPPPSLTSPQAALEQGTIQTVPIGYISSCFSVKNGTPRQPTICGPSRAELRIQQSVFNNPEHALVGLEQYSHVWIIFLFHKNGHLSYKAKVKPPRLNGQRVGVYSTRSPHRPNVLGLTLAKLDKIVGDTVHLSDIDMIAGTPVLDIKPYIPEYDSPQTRMVLDSESCDSNKDQLHSTAVSLNETTDIFKLEKDSETDPQSGLRTARPDEEDDLGTLLLREKSEVDIPISDSRVGAQFSLPKVLQSVLEEVKTFVTQGEVCQLSCESEDQVSDSPKTKPQESTLDHLCYGEEVYSTIAGWIREPPVESLDVRFTPNAERELAEFLPAHLSGGPSDSNRPRFKFLRGPEEAAAAIRGVLSADPRSVYRRTRCRDRLFFFTLDTADITCWFGQGFAEVLQVRPVEQHFTSMSETISVKYS